MFTKRITLFKIFGFEVKLDISWIILAVLVTWSLAEGFFPYYYQGLNKITYWWMGIAGALGLFASIISHELCHSIVAQRYGLPMKGITLFIFGGVAEMSDNPPTAKTEFMMAAAGPASSIALSIILWGVYLAGRTWGWPEPVNGVIVYLSGINLILAIFNLLPAFPLDGGRIFRAALWSWKGNIRWATRIASQTGKGFGTLMIVFGVFNILIGNFIGGMWWFLIGMFLLNAANLSYQQLITRQFLEGEPVARFMNPNPISVSPHLSLKDLVENYIYRYHFKMFPVVENGDLIGCVTLSQIKQIPREEWEKLTVADILKQCSPENTITPEADALKALSIMNKTGNSRLMVVENGQLVGVISLKDLLGLLSLKVDLEGLEK